jgi:Spy/CpxP family protein refolding chaperone
MALHPGRRLAARSAMIGLALASTLFWAPGAPGPAWAQTPAPQSTRGARFGQLLLSLNLSDAQKAKIRGIMQAARDKNKNVTDSEQRRANYRAAFAQVEEVLTPAQRSELHAKIEANRKHPT